VVPLTKLLKSIVVIVLAVQIVCVAGVAIAIGDGFINTVVVIDVPGQPLANGVIVNVTVTGADVVLVSVPMIFPVPLTAIPVTVTVLFLVQLKVVPPRVPLNTIGVIEVPEQIVCDVGVADASGVGLIIKLVTADGLQAISAGKGERIA